jgi:DNA-binding NarL/FixJ family response regulator
MTETRSTVVRRLSTEVKPIVRILLIDPKPHSRSILKGFLRNLSVVQSVYERASTADVIHSLTESPVHLVMIEHDLGQETGLAVIRSIQASALQRKPRFMLMAGQMSEAERREATELGVRTILARPYDINTLERSVLEALGATNGDIQVVRSRTEQLRRLPAFAGFSDLELARLLKLCPLMRVPANQSIYVPGHSGRSLYLIVAGQVHILQGESEARPIALLQPGECFGETAMVHPGKRRLGAQAVTDSWVMEVSHAVFCKEEEPVVLKFVRQLALQFLLRMHAFS